MKPRQEVSIEALKTRRHENLWQNQHIYCVDYCNDINRKYYLERSNFCLHMNILH